MTRDNKNPLRHKISGYSPSTVTIYNRDGDILLREPSLIAIESQSDMLYAIGEDARVFPGGGEAVIVGSPLRGGAIADFDVARLLFKIFIEYTNKQRRSHLFAKPRIAVCAPVDMTEVEFRALNELILSIGAKGVLIIEEPFERAISAIPSSYTTIIEIIPEVNR